MLFGEEHKTLNWLCLLLESSCSSSERTDPSSHDSKLRKRTPPPPPAHEVLRHLVLLSRLRILQPAPCCRRMQPYSNVGYKVPSEPHLRHKSLPTELKKGGFICKSCMSVCNDDECGTIHGIFGRGEPTYSEKNLAQCRFVHHKSHMTSP
jgi:hypothetical protein